MRLYVVRHGIAEEASRSGKDADRALTSEGERKLEIIGAKLVELGFVPARIASSPLLRARQTAEILRTRFHASLRVPTLRDVAICDALEPDGDARAVLDFAARHCAGDDLALVGHLPNVAVVIAAATGADREESFEMKKGGVAVIDFTGTPSRGRGTLHALLTPKILVQGD